MYHIATILIRYGIIHVNVTIKMATGVIKELGMGA